MNWKRILKIIAISCLWLILITGIIILYIAARKERLQVKANTYYIHIDHEKGIAFVDTTVIYSLLNEIGMKDISNMRMDYLNLQRIEKYLEKNQYINNVETYITRRGDIAIEVEQRKPLLRIYNTDNMTFYMDQNKKMIPISDKFIAHVPVVLGVPSGLADYFAPEDSILINQLYDFGLFLQKNEFWSAQVDQIIIKEDKTITLIPRIGLEEIILGTFDNYKEKLDNMLTYYEKNMDNKINWMKYQYANLAFKNQIILTKNKTLTNEQPE